MTTTAARPAPQAAARQEIRLTNLGGLVKFAAVAAVPAERQNLADRRAHLEAPISRIFETRLKPQLDKLPTREQREKADAAGRPKADSQRTP